MNLSVVNFLHHYFNFTKCLINKIIYKSVSNNFDMNIIIAMRLYQIIKLKINKITESFSGIAGGIGNICSIALLVFNHNLVRIKITWLLFISMAIVDSTQVYLSKVT